MIGNIKKNNGFTLVEILVATAIFLIIFVIIVDLAIIFTKDPEIIINQKELEREVDYCMEFLAQKIRVNKIDYDEFELQGYDLSTDNPTSTLYLIDSDGNQINFALSADDFLYNSSALHSSDVDFDSIKFYIYPAQDPFIYNSGYNNNDQPRVVVSLQAHHTDDTSIDNPIYLQTTISTRVYER